ncbi:MAG: hypothetical protein AB7S36_04980 [Planctomycetota bacterium]
MIATIEVYQLGATNHSGLINAFAKLGYHLEYAAESYVMRRPTDCLDVYFHERPADAPDGFPGDVRNLHIRSGQRMPPHCLDVAARYLASLGGDRGLFLMSNVDATFGDPVDWVLDRVAWDYEETYAVPAGETQVVNYRIGGTKHQLTIPARGWEAFAWNPRLMPHISDPWGNCIQLGPFGVCGNEPWRSAIAAGLRAAR